MSIYGSSQSADTFSKLKAEVAQAKESMDRNRLDTLSQEILELGEQFDSDEIRNYGIYIKADALTRKNPSESISYGEKAQAYYSEVQDLLLWSRVTNVLANAYSNKGEHRKGLELYSSVLDVLDDLYDKDNSEGQKYISRVAYNAGFTAVKLGDIDSAIKYLSDAHEVAVTGKDTLLEFSVLIQFGNIYLYRKDNAEALKFYKESFVLASKLSPSLTVFPMFGIGAAFQEMGELDSALVYNLKVMQMHRTSGNKTSLCVTLFNCAELYIDLGRYDDAIALGDELMSYGKEMETNQHILNAANSLGRAYFKKGSIDRAEDIMMEYEKYIDEDVEYDIAQKYYQLASEIAEEQGHISNAFLFHKKYKSFSDSLLNQETLVKVDELRLKLETEKKDQEISELQNINALQKITSQRNIISIAALLASLLFLMFIGYLVLNRRRLKIENQKDKIEQKLLRSQMNPHFIFNAISSIQNYLYDKNDLKIALTYMSQFGELMRQILENSREEFVPLSEEIKTLKNYLELQQMRYNNTFGYEFIIDDDIDTHMIMVPPLIVQPFVENSIEHGMIYRIENGLVKIRFQNREGKLEISIADNGVGSRSIELKPKNIEQSKKSLATIITKERLEYLSKLNKKNFHLAIRALQEGGTLITIQLPLIQAA